MAKMKLVFLRLKGESKTKPLLAQAIGFVVTLYVKICFNEKKHILRTCNYT